MLLAIKASPNLERAVITCPVCKQRSPYTAYKPVSNTPQVVVDEQKTNIMSKTQYCAGRLVFMTDDIADVELSEGRHIIGRDSATSTADIRIPQCYKRVSREHLCIEVRRVNDSFKYILSLCKSDVNATFLNNIQIEAGDQLVLGNGDIIKLPGITIRCEFKML